MQRIFGTVSLGLSEWLFLLSLALIVVFAEEIRKFFSRRFTKTSNEQLKVHDHV
jgi:hypothetical protein